MQLHIQTFGIARDICGGSSISLELQQQVSAGELKQILANQYPRLGVLTSFLLAVNEEYADPSTMLQPDDEIAIIPPVSGG